MEWVYDIDDVAKAVAFLSAAFAVGLGEGVLEGFQWCGDCGCRGVVHEAVNGGGFCGFPYRNCAAHALMRDAFIGALWRRC